MKRKHGERDRTSVSLKSQQKTQKAREAKEKAKTASRLKGLTSTNEKRADTWSSSLDGPERTRPGKGECLAIAGEGFKKTYEKQKLRNKD
jgi:hypothetical protein